MTNSKAPLRYSTIAILFCFSILQDISSPTAKTIIKLFPIGTFVWGKLPGYDWWPGCVVSYDKKEIEKFTEEMDEDEEDITGSSEDDGGNCSDEVAWVKWYPNCL